MATMRARKAPEREADPEEALLGRDYVMARLGAAVACLDAAQQTVQDALRMFVTPSEDNKGKARQQLIDEAIEEAGIATRSLEDALEAITGKEIVVDFSAGEPWEEQDEDEDGAD